MDILITVLITALAGGCGYLGGRWYAAYKQARLQAKLESDSENFMRMLEERNQDYLSQKQQLDRSRQQSDKAQRELSQALIQVEQEQGKHNLLKRQLNALSEKQDRMRLQYRAMDTERQQLRDAKLTLEAGAKDAQQQHVQLTNRNALLEEKCNSALIEKTRLQTDGVNKERELQDLRKRLLTQEDLNESAELTLDQMRSTREVMTRQLAHAEGQLSVLAAHKQSLQPA
ncbi:MAG: chromosome segregation ATPase [Motiliproteus sp.]|jgi:chromosome segregation ATPase